LWYLTSIAFGPAPDVKRCSKGAVVGKLVV
jgi:hypothetical protein